MSPYPIRHPVIFLAFGLGSGLSPKAPGTAGSALALLFFPVLVALGLWGSVALIAVAGVFGIWLCGRAAEILKVHDHSGIVWDEFVGQWLTLLPLLGGAVWDLATVLNVLVGFVLFRIFDIAKPWPISWCDKHLEGGLGIMIDDVLAGAAAGGVLWLLVANHWLF
ncbi:phosphatidylglycerophosphatase [Fluviicoccus keumensis]|uniref:Phosphatidylglycerophosphatase A n=1 Tax=Fluviicoccus keumensis TaxID=1435465 RepID=A0A4Q7ZC90_9GAMM|nr:phosphatidylglycerophosphatase A [Fluviicoccus keumensis]RZU47751.1 phosphatidylglycerophosphatase [Fluviicoccus keumensis]